MVTKAIPPIFIFMSVCLLVNLNHIKDMQSNIISFLAFGVPIPLPRSRVLRQQALYRGC